MITQTELSKQLRSAYSALPQRDQLRDVGYVFDVDPFGADAVVLYLEMARGVELPPERKRAIEAELEEALHDSNLEVFFRWFLEGEDGADDLVVTRRDRPGQALSALRDPQ